MFPKRPSLSWSISTDEEDRRNTNHTRGKSGKYTQKNDPGQASNGQGFSKPRWMHLKTVNLRNRWLMLWEAILSVPLLWDEVACSFCTDYYKAVLWVNSTGPCPDAIWIPNPTVGNGLARAQQFMKARPSVYCLIQEILGLNMTFLLDCSDGPAEVRASKH